jgi:hypothetical protein
LVGAVMPGNRDSSETALRRRQILVNRCGQAKRPPARATPRICAPTSA